MKMVDCLPKFIDFLHTINSKRVREDVGTTFRCQGIDVCIVLVGRPEALLFPDQGYESYLNHIRMSAEKGVKVFYILARGFYCSVAESLAYQASKENLVRETDRYSDEIEYGGTRTKVSCIRLENRCVEAYSPFKDVPNI